MKKYIKLLIFVFTIILIYSTLNAKTIGLLLTDKFESVNCTYLINMVLSDYLIIISFVLMVLVLFYIYKAIDGDPTKLPFIGGGEWTIGIYNGSNPWDLSEPDNIKNPVLTQHDITDIPARGLADPFMVFEDDLWHMFFEVIHAKTNRGEIGCAVSKDGFKWEYKQIVLSEPYHLSYPYVFKCDGKYYMIPESNEGGAVKLYEAESFPFKWKYVKTLLDKGYVDTTLFIQDDTYWFFVSNLENDILELFYSDSLTGTLTEHPQSPLIQNDTGKARPGGRVVIANDKIIRYAQDCRKDYGFALRAFEIVSLSRTNYEEIELPDSPIVKATGKGWNANRMHHLDPHLLPDNSWLASTDGYVRKIQIGMKY